MKMGKCLTEGCDRNIYDKNGQGWAYCLGHANQMVTDGNCRIAELEASLPEFPDSYTPGEMEEKDDKELRSIAGWCISWPTPQGFMVAEAMDTLKRRAEKRVEKAEAELKKLSTAGAPD